MSHTHWVRNEALIQILLYDIDLSKNVLFLQSEDRPTFTSTLKVIGVNFEIESLFHIYSTFCYKLCDHHSQIWSVIFV